MEQVPDDPVVGGPESSRSEMLHNGVMPDDSVTAQFAPVRGYLNTASLGLPPRATGEALHAALDDWFHGRWDAGDFDVHVDTARADLVAAKAGLEHFTRFLAVELGRHGIRANAIAPGSVKTQAWNERVAQDPEILERVKRWYPLGDVCVPDDVAGLAAFLIGPDARMITGAVIAVDGGLTAGSTTMAREFCGAEF